MPRQARLDASGTLHHVIIRGIEKRRIVDNQKDREEFVSRLGKVTADTKTSIYAWSLMTNHAHLLLRSGPRVCLNSCDACLPVMPLDTIAGIHALAMFFITVTNQ